MKWSNAEYRRHVDAIAPKSPCLKNCINAFLTGGGICLLGQILTHWFQTMELERYLASAAASICLVLLSSLLTGLAIYDDIAKFAGAGTLVPITGFANSIVSPAVEFKTEGVILGTCGKMFTIAGPVLVYGVSASVIYGLIYWLWNCAI